MGSFEESQFFDAVDQILPEIDSSNSHYDLWFSQPRSVQERRLNFIRQMGFSPSEFEANGSSKTFCSKTEDCEIEGDLDEEKQCSSSTSWLSSSCIEGDVGFCQCVSENESCNSECECDDDDENRSVNKLKWLSKLRKMASMFRRSAMELNGLERAPRGRIKVRNSRKNLRELSGLFAGQDIKAHEGSITVMKFSPDGKFLASAGEDKVVKVWKVVEDERSNVIDVPDYDPSCVYFSVKHISQLGRNSAKKAETEKFQILRKSPDSACVILPPKVFRIVEKPLHVFQGHDGEILDLSWSSKNNCLLSSSTDKTVRLWRVGTNRCLGIFLHMDYVTCVQFNPMNDGYFVSGSIDGKVRVWEIEGCRVVCWSEMREIITAVSYRPDGLGGVIGFITGACRFFNISEGLIELEAQVCLTSKNGKKRTCKKITGFQFSPRDPSKVLVTCADSRVRIISGTDVIAKYRGFRNAGNHLSASFASDNKHIISSSDDSNIYAWNYDESLLPRQKPIHSFECFHSNASVATTWPGFKRGKNRNSDVALSSCRIYENTLHQSLAFSSSTACFSLGRDFHLDCSSVPPKGSATWPEEKLLPTTPWSPPTPRRGKACQNSRRSLSDSHAWGLVFVAGGWDGRIKCFHNYGLPLPL